MFIYSRLNWYIHLTLTFITIPSPIKRGKAMRYNLNLKSWTIYHGLAEFFHFCTLQMYIKPKFIHRLWHLRWYLKILIYKHQSGKLDFKTSRDKNKKCNKELYSTFVGIFLLSINHPKKYNTAVIKIYKNLTSMVTILTFHQLNLPFSDTKMFNLPIYNNANQLSTKFCKLFLYL